MLTVHKLTSCSLAPVSSGLKQKPSVTWPWHLPFNLYLWRFTFLLLILFCVYFTCLYFLFYIIYMYFKSLYLCVCVHYLSVQVWSCFSPAHGSSHFHKYHLNLYPLFSVFFCVWSRGAWSCLESGDSDFEVKKYILRQRSLVNRFSTLLTHLALYLTGNCWWLF